MSLHHPVRGGVRGGKDQFEWEDVKADKYRENYLGHSLRAPVGRWQKGKDLTWYTKDSIMTSEQEKLKAEVAALKKAEEEMMAAALGLKPTATPKQGQPALSRQEIAEVCRRSSTEEREWDSEDRIKGVGYQSHRSAVMYSGASSTVLTEKGGGVTVFEHDPSLRKSDGKLTLVSSKDRDTDGSTGAPQPHHEPSRPSMPPPPLPPPSASFSPPSPPSPPSSSSVLPRHSHSKHKHTKKHEKKSKKHKRHISRSPEPRKRRRDREDKGSSHRKRKRHNRSRSASD